MKPSSAEEPVHDDEQHRYGEQPGRRLHVQAGPAECADDADRDEPRRHRRKQRNNRAAGDRPPQRPPRTREARSERRKDENRLEPFAEDEERAVEHHGAVTEVRVRRGRR